MIVRVSLAVAVLQRHVSMHSREAQSWQRCPNVLSSSALSERCRVRTESNISLYGLGGPDSLIRVMPLDGSNKAQGRHERRK